MKFRKKTIRDVSIAGKVVLVRVDYNVPMKDGRIVDDARIRASLPTLKYLIKNGAKKIILISHIGRPGGEEVLELSLGRVARRLASLLRGRRVGFVDGIVGEDVAAAVDYMPRGGILVLENLRFLLDEEENSDEFARQIVESTGADLFVQDGFAVIHRAHASTDAIAKILPSVAGFLLEKEVSRLEKVIHDPEHPLLVIVGGAKVEDKAPLIEKFLPVADMIAVGGKIAADGYVANDEKIYVAEDFVEDENGKKLDIGKNSTARILEMVHDAKTIVWNGTLGMVEDKRYAKASLAIATAIGMSDAMTIVGGGDTTGFVKTLRKDNPQLKFDLISTGGGASLELLCGKKLPGLEVLEDR